MNTSFNVLQVKSPLWFIKHLNTKICGGVEVRPYVFLNLVLDGGDWPSPHLCGFNPREKSPPVNFSYAAGWAPQPVWNVQNI